MVDFQVVHVTVYQMVTYQLQNHRVSPACACKFLSRSFGEGGGDMRRKKLAQGLLLGKQLYNRSLALKKTWGYHMILVTTRVLMLQKDNLRYSWDFLRFLTWFRLNMFERKSTVYNKKWHKHIVNAVNAYPVSLAILIAGSCGCCMAPIPWCHMLGSLMTVSDGVGNIPTTYSNVFSCSHIPIMPWKHLYSLSSLRICVRDTCSPQPAVLFFVVLLVRWHCGSPACTVATGCPRKARQRSWKSIKAWSARPACSWSIPQ